MRLILLIIIVAFNLNIFTCLAQKTIEVPLTQKNGFGGFNFYLVKMSTNTNEDITDIENPWRKTYLNVTGIPTDWEKLKIGNIETNIYQNVYQNYNKGNITKEWYNKLLKSWSYWKPDTTVLIKKYIKTKIAFAVGIDSVGKRRMIVDANNNLDFSDDKSFIPYNGWPSNSDALKNSITVNFEKYIHNKVVNVSTLLFVAYYNDIDLYMCNFPQYSIANFNGQEIAVCSDHFGNLSYERPTLALIDKNSISDNEISEEKQINKNEFVEIKGTQYKFKGVNTNKNTLVLEKSEDIYSAQIGYKSPLFKGEDFLTGSEVSLDKIRGKYILLDFWATSCGPCRQELPNLKKLYEETYRDKFEIIGIVGESKSEDLQSLCKKHSISWPQILNSNSNIIEKYGIKGYPKTILINQEGIIIAKDLRGKELEEKVLELTKTPTGNNK